MRVPHSAVPNPVIGIVTATVIILKLTIFTKLRLVESIT